MRRGLLNTDYFYKIKNSLHTEIKLIVRCKATMILLLCSIIINSFEFFYILPYDRVLGNSIALSSWITQIYIILGIAFGVIISDKENCELKELISALSATLLKNLTKIMVVFLHAIVLYVISSVFAVLSLSIKDAAPIFITAAIKYIGLYWILPFIIACLIGLLISYKTIGKIKYVLALLFIIVSGPMLPTLLEPIIDTSTGAYKYISICNIGSLYATKPMHLMFGYFIPFEKCISTILLFISLVILFLVSGILHRRRKCFGIMIAFCLIMYSYFINFNYIALNYDYEIAMDMYKTYSVESKLKPNNNYIITSMDVLIDEHLNSFDFDTVFKTQSEEDLSYLTFTLYHGFKINSISINGVQCNDFVQDKDLIAIMDLFEANKEYVIELKYSGIPAIHMYSNYKNWFLPEYFAWYPIQGNDQNIVYSNDLFDINFIFQEPQYNIDFHIKLNGNNVLYCNLNQTDENEWRGTSKGITLLDSEFMEIVRNDEALYIYPISCRNYDQYMSSYLYNLVKYQKILDMSTCSSSTLIFICDTTYTGHGEKIRIFEDGAFIEITRAYVDGTELRNPNLGIYSLIKDKYLKYVTDVDFEYLFKCSYIVSLANQGKINNDDVVRDLDDLYNIYKENAGYDDFAKLVEVLSEFIETGTPRQQAKFFDEWSVMLNDQNYDISQTIVLLETVEND